MPPVDIQIAPCFCRNPASNIHVLRPQNAAQSQTIDDVVYITDHDPAVATEMIWDTIARDREFCVCHDIPQATAPTIPRSGKFFQTQTGGTTGTPKRVRRTHASWIQSYDKNADLFDISSSDSYGILGRLGHSLALYAALEANHIGADIQFLAGAQPHAQMTQIIDEGVSIIYATPTQLRRFRNGVAPKVRYILCGGGVLDDATRDGIRSRFPNAALHEFYGASETSFISLADTDTPHGSVGRPYPGVTVDIRSPDAAGIGEIWVQSPYLFTDYADGAADKKWVSAGEMGHMHDGYLTLMGRRDRMITIADQNVFPETIETAIRTTVGVIDACVTPLPDTARGHVLRAYIVADGLDVQALETGLKRRFGPLIAPKTIRLVDKIPTTHSGKHDLSEIQKWATSDDT